MFVVFLLEDIAATLNAGGYWSKMTKVFIVIIQKIKITIMLTCTHLSASSGTLEAIVL